MAGGVEHDADVGLRLRVGQSCPTLEGPIKSQVQVRDMNVEVLRCDRLPWLRGPDGFLPATFEFEVEGEGIRPDLGPSRGFRVCRQRWLAASHRAAEQAGVEGGQRSGR